MALSAINEICNSENNYLSDLLKTYQQDILAKESVQFFRGKHTKKEVEKIDQQVGDLLSLLCLELIEKQNIAKIIEYLLRIYEPHKHYPKALFFSILPLHETVWFSKITQLLAIEQQGELADIFFIKELAYKGERPPFAAILEAKLRNHASLFSQYSKWYFERFNHIQYDSYNFQVSSTLDTRFFSYLLIAAIETLEQRQDESESQIQSILPYISLCFSKALVSSNGQKLTQTDVLSARQKILLKTGIYSLSILSGFRKLTINFKEAFVQQLASVCKWSLSVTLQPEIEIFEKALLVIIQFNLQKPFINQAADLPYLIFINQNGVKSLIKLANKHDISHFIPKILVNIFQKDESLIQKVVEKFQVFFNLKTLQQIILSIISGHFGPLETSSSALQLRNHLRSLKSLRLVYYQAASLIIQNLRSKAIDTQSKDQAINLLLNFCIFDQKGSFNEQKDLKGISAVQEQIIKGICQTSKLQVRRQSFMNLVKLEEIHLFAKILLLSQVEEMNSEENSIMKQIDFKISKKTRKESIALSNIDDEDNQNNIIQKLPLKQRKDSFCEPEFKILPQDFVRDVNHFLNNKKVNNQDLQNLERFLHKSLSTLFENDEKSSTKESDLIKIFQVCFQLLKQLSVQSAQELNENSKLIILSSSTFYIIQIINTVFDLLPKEKIISLVIENNKNFQSLTIEILNFILQESLQNYIVTNKQKVEAQLKKIKQIEENPFDRFIAEMESDEEMQEEILDMDTYTQTISLILDMISSLLILFTKLDIKSSVNYFCEFLIIELSKQIEVQSEPLVQEFKLQKSKKFVKSILEQNEMKLTRSIFKQMLQTNEDYILELLLCSQELGQESLLLTSEAAFLISNLCGKNNQTLLNQIFRLYLTKVQDIKLIGELLVIANLVGQDAQQDWQNKVDLQKLNLIAEGFQTKGSNLQLAILESINSYLDPQSSIFFDQLSVIAHENVDETQNTLQVCQMALLQLREMALPLRDENRVFSHIIALASQVGNHLDSMTSTQLQIAIVLNLIGDNSWQYFLDNKQQLKQLSEAMKTLLDKTAVFWGQMSEGQQQHRSKEYQELIEVLLQKFILQFQTSVFKGKKQMVLVRTFLCQTFNLFRKISCSFSSRNWLSSSLKLGFQLLNDSVLLSDNLLQAEILLCVTHIQEVCLIGNSVKGVKVYEHIPNLIQTLLTQLSHILANITSEHIDKVDGFMSQRVMAILQSLLSLYTFSHQFINSEQHHTFLHNTLLLTDLLNHSNEQVLLAKTVLEQMIQCSFVSSGTVSVLRTIMNIYSEVFVSVGAKQNDLKNIGKVWSLYTQSILNKTFISGSHIANESHSKLQAALIEENHENISTFIVKMASLPSLFFKYQKTDMANLNNFEQDLVNFINDYCLKLKPDQLSGLIHQLSKWAFKGVISSKEIARNVNEEQYDLHKQVIFYKILSGIVGQLKEFSIPYVIKYYSQLISVLKQTIEEFSKATQKLGKKRAKVEIDSSRPLINSLNIDGTGHTLYKLICEILKHLEIVFASDTQSLLQIDNYEQLVDEAQLCEIFTLVGYIQEVGKTNDFANKILHPVFYEMINRSDNASWWNILNREILMKTRQNYAPIIRKTCLQMVLYLFERLSERYLVVLNDSLQFMSESLEDGDEGVEMAAKQLVARIESLTGESIQAYLK